MPIPVRTLGSVPGRILSPLVLAASVLLASPFAAAQVTAPQLLPYTVSKIAGGGTTAIAVGATCPVSGYTSTDAYGDGCLASEVQLVAPRYAVSDTAGNVFFSDYTNGLIRRVDGLTGIVTAVAGGVAASPASGVTCGANTSIDARGDGCLANLVHLGNPTGLVFYNGDLYFADAGQYDVRKISATAGLINSTGVISNIAGYAAGAATRGFTSDNASATIVAATQSYLYAPYGLAVDGSGDLFISEEYKNAILVVNLNATGNTVVNGITIPAGTISKVVGASGTSTPPSATCPNGTSGTYGCSYNPYVEGNAANDNWLDSPYSIAVDPSGTLYIANEFNQVVPKVSVSGIMTTFAGNQATYGAVTTVRATAGSFAIGSDFGVAADTSSNVYITDAFNGVVWRVDGATQSMYVIAGAAATPCSKATDTYGDGCPATQATFGATQTSSTKNYSIASSPGIFGVSVDIYSDLFIGDTVTNLVREISSGTQFGPIGANQPTQTVDVHFAKGDTPAASAYTLTKGAANFSLGSATCTSNSDGTTDCLLPVTATPAVVGAFTGTLTVQSTLGATASFSLAGTYVMSPITRTAVTAVASTTCTGGGVISTSTPVVLTATVAGSGSPTGSVTFYANGAPIGTPVTIVNGVAKLTYTFSAVNTYAVTAIYSGDTYFKTSTGASQTPVVTSMPSFAASAIANTQGPVVAGQTALFSFNVALNVYAGTITMSCANLPANSACVFSPLTLAGTGCSTASGSPNVVALSIVTQSGPVASSFGGIGRGPWSALSIVSGVLLALAIGMRRRRSAMRFGQIWMALALLIAGSGLLACSTSTTGGPRTPAGSYTVTVTANGSTGTTSSFPVTLIVQ